MFRLCDNNMSVSIDFSPKHKKQFALKPKRVRYDSRQPSRKINSEPRDSLFKANFDSKHRKL